jgi:phenylalanyl-tRNA synthetase beta subunit
MRKILSPWRICLDSESDGNRWKRHRFERQRLFESGYVYIYETASKFGDPFYIMQNNLTRPNSSSNDLRRWHRNMTEAKEYVDNVLATLGFTLLNDERMIPLL